MMDLLCDSEYDAACELSDVVLQPDPVRRTA